MVPRYFHVRFPRKFFAFVISRFIPNQVLTEFENFNSSPTKARCHSSIRIHYATIITIPKRENRFPR